MIMSNGSVHVMNRKKESEQGIYTSGRSKACKQMPSSYPTCRLDTGRRRTPGPPLSKGTVASSAGTLPETSHTLTLPSSWPVKYMSLLPTGSSACRWGRPPENTHRHLPAVPVAVAKPADALFSAYSTHAWIKTRACLQ